MPFGPNSCFLQRFPIISLMHLTITKVSASGFPPKAREKISIFFLLFSQPLSSIQLQQTILLRLPQNYTSQFNARFHYYTRPGNMDTSFGVPYPCHISVLTALSCYYFSEIAYIAMSYPYQCSCPCFLALCICYKPIFLFSFHVTPNLLSFLY